VTFDDVLVGLVIQTVRAGELATALPPGRRAARAVIEGDAE
jgi:hypothetical protein